MQDDVHQVVRSAERDGGLPCAVVFSLAARLGQSPAAIRYAADETSVKITLCQLGLFGYDAFGERRWVHKFAALPQRLEQEVADALVDGKLPCASAWSLAERWGVPRPVVGWAAQTLGLSIGPCQLGLF